MKGLKILIVVTILVLLAVGFMACNEEVKAEGEYTIVSPDGAPALALAGLANNAQITETLKVSPTIVSSTLIKSEAIKADFAIVPANMASIIYNTGEEYKMIASITNGNMFIVAKENDENFSLENMKGKMLYTIGQGSIPAMILLATLKANNIPFEISETPVEGKVAIQYCADGPALRTKIVSATSQVYGNLAEPAVSTFVKAGAMYKVADLQELWQQATSSSIKGYVQAVLIAKKSLCEEKPEVVNEVLSKITIDIGKVYLEPEKAREAIKSIYEETSLKTPIDETIVQGCNLNVYKAKEYVDYIYNTLNMVYEMNPQAVGGSVPAKDSGFYY